MNALLFTATLVALSVAAVESQRRTNAQASARQWHRAHQAEHQLVERLQSRIDRLETALGRRERRWVPLHHVTPPVPTADDLARLEAEMAEWSAEIQGRPWTGCDGRRIALIDDPESCTPRLAPSVRPSTARLRRLVGVA